MPVSVLYAGLPRTDGDRKQIDCDVAFSGEYEAGGIMLPANAVGLSSIEHVDDAIGEGYLVRFVRGSFPAKIQLYGAADATSEQTEVVDGTDLTGLDEVRLRVIGW